jgi:hypothetical protein
MMNSTMVNKDLQRENTWVKPMWMFALLILASALLLCGPSAQANNNGKITFKGVRTQFLATLGDPKASSGYGVQSWGLWERDPGPRGVWLKNFDQQLVERGGVAPANWKFDNNDWWLDENGLIMEKPVFSVQAGRYIVTGDREMVAMLTIHEIDDKGMQRWELDSDATLYDVTHLPCRSARYTPTSGAACTPASAERSYFPVTPGGTMPVVGGCQKQDYSVLFIVAVEVKD